MYFIKSILYGMMFTFILNGNWKLTMLNYITIEYLDFIIEEWRKVK